MRIAGVILVVVLATAGRAFAFEETIVPGLSKSGVSHSDVPGVMLEDDPAKILELSTSGDKGLEVQLPGLGTIGVLPKLDFGLELLYGANQRGDGDLPLELNAPEAQPDDITVRGAIKNTF